MEKFIYKNRYLILVSFIFTALLCIVFKDVIFSDYIFARRDIARLYLPVREFVVSSIKNFEAPLWNPYVFCGAPLHASIHHAVFYPLTIIYYIGDFTRGFSFFILFHIFLCGLFTYIFTRSISISKLGSFLAGFSFMFSGYVMSTICLTTVLSSVTWFPLVLFLFLKSLKKRTLFLPVALGVVLSLMFIAGDPPTFIVTCALLFLYSLYLIIEGFIKKRELDLFIIYSMFAASVAFLLLTAFQIIPAIEYYSQTVRTSMSWQEASAWSLPYNHILSFIIPYFNEPAFFSKNFLEGQKWLDNYYLGIITLLLASFALFYSRRKKITWFLFAMGIFSIALSLGRYFFLFPIFFKAFPGFSFIRYPVRFLFIFSFSTCVLSGMGFDALKMLFCKGRPEKIGGAFLIIGFLTAIIAIIFMAIPEKIIAFIMHYSGKMFHFDSGFVYADLFNLRRSLFYVSSFGVFLFLFSRIKQRKLIIVPILILAVFDLLFTNTDYNFIEDREYFKRPTKNISFLLRDKSIFRIFPSPYSYDMFSVIRGESLHKAVETSKDLLANNQMMQFGISDAWGYDSSKLSSNNEMVKLIYLSKLPNDTNLLNLLNVKYISSHGDLSAYGYKKVSTTEKSTIYQNIRYLPRAMLLRNILSFDNDNDMLDYMSTRKFNPKKEVLLKEDIILSGSFDRNIRKDTLSITEYSPRRIAIDVSAKTDAVLLLSDTYYTGWKVYLDGVNEKIYCADFFLRAVLIPAGKHKVEFVYDPWSFKIGSIISSISLLLLILYIAISVLRLTSKKLLSIINKRC